jgi:hypothetical protein
MVQNKLVMAALVLLFSASMSSCSVIGGKSEAYKLGVQTGKQYLSLKDASELVDSYVPEEADPELSLELNASAEDLKTYCSGLWIITGISNGIRNSEENKADYVAGCLDGAGF